MDELARLWVLRFCVRGLESPYNGGEQKLESMTSGVLGKLACVIRQPAYWFPLRILENWRHQQERNGVKFVSH